MSTKKEKPMSKQRKDRIAKQKEAQVKLVEEKRERQQESTPAGELSGYQKGLAKIADLSYQKNDATRRKWIKSVDPYGNLQYLNEDSTKHIGVARDKNLGEIYVSHRGTKLSGSKLEALHDLNSDISIVMGTEDHGKRWKEAEEHYLQLKQKYPGEKIIFTSHSLGGNISNHLARKFDETSHSWNPGSGLGAVRDLTGNKFKEEPKKGKIIQYKTDGVDLISLLGVHGADELVEVKGKEGMSAHTLANFL